MPVPVPVQLYRWYRPVELARTVNHTHFQLLVTVVRARVVTIAIGALASLTTLDLRKNAISDDGMKALADACASGALAPGATVYLGSKSATETGKQAMRDAAKARGLSAVSYTHLTLPTKA